jgi:tetratricopeptide (TPR) repeat protein
LVAALAFLLASTPARNSDLWLHLASGRSLVRGLAPLGTDPFASTTTGVFWVNHTWLSDAVLYALYDHGGGRALVIAKALLVAALAGLFFCFRRSGTRVGVGAPSAAVLALAPWLSLQPVLFSLVGVVLTLYLLERPGLVEEAHVARARALRWLLLPLFALWANLDGWFLLGPVLVGLYALGEWLRRLAGSRSLELLALALLAPAGLAACLLTPYHFRSLTWPAPLGLSHAEQVLMRDPLGQGLVHSPFGGRAAPAFAGPAGWAYCLLLAAGAGSFVLLGRNLHPGRLLAWLALAALTLYQARAIPFFAVAAGPVLALNMQDWAGLREKRERGEEEKRRQSIIPGLFFSFSPLVLCSLLLLAWPGWLQPAPHQPRGWAIEPDGSLVRLSCRLEDAHREESPPGRFVLTLSPESAHYLAWFCPSERGFLDSRWPLFEGAADDFVQMRRCLLTSDDSGPDPALGPLLDAHHIDRILVHDADWQRTTQAYRCLLRGNPEWQLLSLEGGAALFGRRLAAGSACDLRRAAYHPEPDQAPLAAPRPPEPPGWLDAFTRARDDRSPDRAETALYLIYFDLMAERKQRDLSRQRLLSHATGLVASAPAAPAGALAMRLALLPRTPHEAMMTAGFLSSRDRGPVEALWLAVRAARRALVANPDDGGAFLLLGETYLRLASCEPSWQVCLPALATLRQLQAVTALEQAVLLAPDLDQAHALLARLYYEQGQMDRRLDHLETRLWIARKEAAGRGPGAAAAAQRQAALEADRDAVAELVRRAEDIYAANAEGLSDPTKVFDRARLASRHGLSRKALEMLLESHPAIFGSSGAQLQLELMLHAGRAFEVRAWMQPDHEAVLGYSTYHWLELEAALACGDYTMAEAEVDRLSEEARQVRISAELVLPVRSAVGLRVAGAVLDRPVFGSGPPGLAASVFQQFEAVRPLEEPAGLLRQEADFRVLSGLIALESGSVGNAREQFRTALAVWGGPERSASGAGLDFPTRSVAQEALRELGQD